MTFAFLKSVRFWKLFIVALLMTLQKENMIDGAFADSVAQIVEIVLGGSVVIRTVDRFADKLTLPK